MRRIIVVVLALLVALTGCADVQFPRDPEGTLDRVSGGTLRVGVTERDPFTEVGDDGRVTGTEAGIVEGYARSIGARVAWVPGSEAELMEGLDLGDVDVVIGGFYKDSPWEKDAAFTRAYDTQQGRDGKQRELVLATRLGENAFLVSLERYLIDQGLEP